MNYFYHSTRSTDESVTSKKAIRKGIADDGGLYVSDSLGSQQLDLGQVCSQDYRSNARLVLGSLLSDFSDEEMNSCVERAYGSSFSHEAVCPVTPMGSDYLLELFHGPTSAFKDVALQMLPHLMATASADAGEKIMIVCATSGDTGKAALAGFADAPGVGVSVFYPAGGVSDIQRLQMVSQAGNNVAVCAIHGNFDDAQTEVKHIFSDHDLSERLSQRSQVLSSANSINVGRLAPQVVYYFDAYAQLVSQGALTQGQAVDFCVPTGNFGDVLAGYYAKRMGLPVGKLIVATNINNVLHDFIETGRYDRRRPFHKTISPSMDILVSSNLERLLYYLSEGDCELIASLMGQLNDEGFYQIPPALFSRLRGEFESGTATDDMTRQAIHDVWESEQVLLDPHTAVARCVLDARKSSENPRVCLATASPYKFSADVLQALGASTEGLDGLACMDKLHELTGVAVPRPLASLRDAHERWLDEVDVSDMSSYVEQACERLLS
ncbi:MAG: threonine synthase [Atopobiaceae bacterium]|nr:threonine synthase [Atopobiaceae bacterium]